MEQGTKRQISQDERIYAAIIHLTQLLGTSNYILGILFPFFMWLIKKDQSRFIDQTGKEIINFQISILIYMIILGIISVLTFGLALLISLPVILAFGLIMLILTIIGAVKAMDGKIFRYPLNLRLIK
jgi:uncharacterized Tic20 family protein